MDTPSLKFVSLLDTPNPNWDTDTPKLFVLFEEWALEIPSLFIRNSTYLQEMFPLHRNNLIPNMEYVCCRQECFDVFKAVEQRTYPSRSLFVPCAKIMATLQVDVSVLFELIPLHLVERSNFMRFIHLIFVILKSSMGSYKELGFKICSEILNFKPKERHLQTYTKFKRVVRLCIWGQK